MLRRGRRGRDFIHGGQCDSLGIGGNLLENDDAVQGLWEHRRAPSTQPSGFMEGFQEEGPMN